MTTRDAVAELDFQVRQAVRTGIKPLVGFYGKSGGGKTRSALLLARGIVGPKGRVVLVDSEQGRGSIFADKIPGGYSVIDLQPPFTPARYVRAFQLAEQNADIVVVDSLSHCWSGEGGVLEMQEAELNRMAGDNWQKREQCKMAAWIQPKSELKKLTHNTILRSKLPVIVCLRGEEKTHIVKSDGKTKVVTDEWSTPIFDHRFIFEMLICAEVYSIDGKGGFLHITKITHEDLFTCLPKQDQQVTVQHGAQLAQWSSGGATPTTTPQPNQSMADKMALKRLKSAIWDAGKSIHLCQPGDPSDVVSAGKNRLEQLLWDEAILGDTEALDSLPESRLAEVLAGLQNHIAKGAQ